jgi:hypothetical protein
MTKATMGFTRALILTLAFSYCGGPQFLQAQSAQNPADQAPQAGQTQSQPTDRGVVDPSRGPLTPVPPGENNNPASAQEESGTPPAPAPQDRTERPAGAAVGQAGITAGGPASRPAGNAIAPAQQHQSRSLLIKIGAIAAASVALGTVIALTRGTSSKPPGAK